VGLECRVDLPRAYGAHPRLVLSAHGRAGSRELALRTRRHQGAAPFLHGRRVGDDWKLSQLSTPAEPAEALRGPAARFYCAKNPSPGIFHHRKLGRRRETVAFTLLPKFRQGLWRPHPSAAER
jgi:hypothetical protein